MSGSDQANGSCHQNFINSIEQSTISGSDYASLRSTKLKSSPQLIVLQIFGNRKFRAGEVVKLQQNLAYHLCFKFCEKFCWLEYWVGGMGQHNEACACWYQYPDIVELQSRAAHGLKWRQRWWWLMVDVWEFNVGSRFKKNTDASYSISNKASPAQKVFFASFFELF